MNENDSARAGNQGAYAARWVPVVGYEGLYEVSSDGQVRACRTGTVLKARGDTSGPYLKVNLSRHSIKKTVRVHRIVAIAFLGVCPSGQQTRHLDGNPCNNRVSNLAYGSPSENAFDKQRHGTDHNLNKTHCPQGHGYTPENTHIRRGERECVACRGISRRRRRRAAREVKRRTRLLAPRTGPRAELGVL